MVRQAANDIQRKLSKTNHVKFPTKTQSSQSNLCRDFVEV